MISRELVENYHHVRKNRLLQNKNHQLAEVELPIFQYFRQSGQETADTDSGPNLMPFVSDYRKAMTQVLGAK